MCVCSVMCDSFVISWTIVFQVPMPMEFSWQEYWSVLFFPIPEDLPNQGIEPVSLVSSELAGRFFTTEPPGKPPCVNFKNPLVAQPNKSKG